MDAGRQANNFLNVIAIKEELDNMCEAMNCIAKLLGSYYKALLNSGFSPEQASHLCSNYQDIILIPRGGNEDE